MTCSKLSGRVHGTVRLTSCSPRSKRYASAKVKPDGIVTWSTSSKVTVTFLPPATAVGRGTCARGRTEWDLAGAVTGGTATNTAFGDSVFARMCATPTGSVTLVPHSRFLL